MDIYSRIGTKSRVKSRRGLNQHGAQLKMELEVVLRVAHLRSTGEAEHIMRQIQVLLMVTTALLSVPWRVQSLVSLEKA